MRSDCEEIPGGFTKSEADKAEIMEYQEQAGVSSRSTSLAAACQTYWPSPYQVCDPFVSKYNQLGGPNSFLLYPKAAAVNNPGSTGKRQDFIGGNLYWSSATGARPVAHEFLTKYGSVGYESGFLKYPTTDEIILSDGANRRQEFQGGSIYFAYGIGAYIVTGAIRDRWRELGAEGSYLGFPITDERTTSDGGRYNRFQNGVIYWSASTGAHPVAGGILTKWADSGYENGGYGYPIAAATTNNEGVTYTQKFEGGTITAPGPIPIELSEINVGTTPEEMIAAAQDYAQGTGGSLIQVLEDALAASRIAIPVDAAPGEDELLPEPLNVGDIFYSNSTTARYNHGHNGIFDSKTTSIESAQSTNGVARRDNTADGGRTALSPQLGTVIGLPQVRQSAVDHAVSKIGKSYNNNFAFNKQINDEQYNGSSDLRVRG